MKVCSRIVLFALLILLALAAQDPKLYRKILNTIDPEAKCLDGTPGLLYTHEGS